MIRELVTLRALLSGRLMGRMPELQRFPWNFLVGIFFSSIVIVEEGKHWGKGKRNIFF